MFNLDKSNRILNELLQIGFKSELQGEIFLSSLEAYSTHEDWGNNKFFVGITNKRTCFINYDAPDPGSAGFIFQSLILLIFPKLRSVHGNGFCVNNDQILSITLNRINKSSTINYKTFTSKFAHFEFHIKDSFPVSVYQWAGTNNEQWSRWSPQAIESLKPLKDQGVMFISGVDSEHQRNLGSSSQSSVFWNWTD